MTTVSPAGPVVLPAGGTLSLAATATRPAFNQGGLGCGGGSMLALAVQPDGYILAAGAYQHYNGDPATPHGLIRLRPDGQRDPTFNAGGSGFGGGISNGTIFNVLLQADGKIVAGGNFTTYNGQPVSNHVVRLLANGQLDPTFNPGGVGIGSTGNVCVRALAQQADGKLLVGGTLDSYNGVPTTALLVRLTTNGSLDTGFNPGGRGFVHPYMTLWSVLVQPDGKILAGGWFNGYNTSAGSNLLRLLPSGAIDTSFYPSGAGGFNDIVWDMALQPDGKILAAGAFTEFNYLGVAQGLARLLPTGQLDASFNAGGAGVSNRITKVVLQPDGKILAGGNFTGYNGNAAAPDHLMRLQADGSLDTSFNAGGSGFGDFLWSLALQPDGRILAGGNFASYNGAYVPGFVARLEADGSLNTTAKPVVTPTYRWSTGATTSTLSVTQPGTYTVAVTVGGFAQTSAPVVVAGPLAAATAGPPVSVSLFPNPAREHVTLDVPNAAGSPQRLALALYNRLGQCVRHYPSVAVPAQGLQTSLSVAGLPAGLYTLRLALGEWQSERSLVVE